MNGRLLHSGMGLISHRKTLHVFAATLQPRRHQRRQFSVKASKDEVLRRCIFSLYTFHQEIILHLPLLTGREKCSMTSLRMLVSCASCCSICMIHWKNTQSWTRVCCSMSENGEVSCLVVQGTNLVIEVPPSPSSKHSQPTLSITQWM